MIFAVEGGIKRISWLWSISFVLCFLYWGYLIANTAMVVVCDSVEYERTGRLIYEQGWQRFFQTGPHREPLYPALIALAMAGADILNVSYQLLLKVFQIGLVFITQILLLKLLRKCGIREGITAGALLYFGLSPAVMNGALSVYYEIVVFPLVVAAVLLAAPLWRGVVQGKVQPCLLLRQAVLLSLCCSLLVLGRGVFQYVFIMFLCVAGLLSLVALTKRRIKIFLRFCLVLGILGGGVGGVIAGYKSLNAHFNGHPVLARSHLSIVLGSAYKRSQPLTAKIALTHVLTIPGNGVCRMFFSAPDCDYADWYGAELFREDVVTDTLEGLSEKHQQKVASKLAWQLVKPHIINNFFFSGIEALKMSFWESTKIGYVDYPAGLSSFYDYPLMRFGLRFFMGLLTLLSMGYMCVFLWQGVWGGWRDVCQEKVILLSFVFMMIAAYTGVYALCYVVTRYSLPIASLYIVIIAFMLDMIIRQWGLSREPGK